MIYLEFKNDRESSRSSTPNPTHLTEIDMTWETAERYKFSIQEGKIVKHVAKAAHPLYYDQATDTVYPFSRAGAVYVGQGQMDSFIHVTSLEVGIRVEGVLITATKEDQNGLTSVFVDYLSDPTGFEPTNFKFSNDSILEINRENILRVKNAWKTYRKEVLNNG